MGEAGGRGFSGCGRCLQLCGSRYLDVCEGFFVCLVFGCVGLALKELLRVREEQAWLD
jgi:hypothetical protein